MFKLPSYLIKSYLILFTMGFFSLGLDQINAKELEWRSFRGPNRNGIAPDTRWSPKALMGSLKVNWTKNLGLGYSMVSVQGQNLYTMGYDVNNEKNIIYCLDVKTGNEKWRYSFEAPKNKYSGPKSTPVLDGILVYTLSQDGLVLANNAYTGSLVWKQDLKQLGGEVLRWGLSSSVLIEGNLAIVNSNQHGIAFNKLTGSVIWKSPAGDGNYSTPVVYTYKNKKNVAIYGEEHLYSLDIQNGKIAWKYPWNAKFDIIAADPLIFNNKVFISSGYGRGNTLIDISGIKPRKVWRKENLNTHFSTAIYYKNYIYGVHGNAGSGELRCLDPRTGKIKWSHDTGFGAFIISKGYIIMINEKGTLRLIEANHKKYKEIASHKKIMKKLCWSAPVLVRSTLYLRNNKGNLMSINLR